MLGLVSLVTLFGAAPFTIVLSIVTLGLAGKAKSKIAGEPARYRGAGLASAAIFLGLFGLIFAAFIKGCVR
jgi:hypothetical protein